MMGTIMAIDLHTIITPFVGGLIGYVTNWIAIKMMFRPYEAKYLFGKKVPFTPGIIPKRRDVLSKKIGDTVASYLINDETITKTLLDPSVKENIISVFKDSISDIKNSELAIGDIFGSGENSSLANEQYAQKLIDFLYSNEFYDIIKKIENDILENEQKNEPNRKIRDFVSFDLEHSLKGLAKDNLNKFRDFAIDFCQGDFFKDRIKPIIISLIDDNVKGLASLFVIPERIYENFLVKLIEFLDDEQNNDFLYDKFNHMFDKSLDFEVLQIAELLKKENGLVFSNFILKVQSSENENGKLFKDSIGSYCEKVIKKVFDIKIIKIISPFSGLINSKLETLIDNKYEDIIKDKLPPLLSCIDFSQIVTSKIDEFEMKEAEKIILDVVDKELKAITYFGGLLGFLIGIFMI